MVEAIRNSPTALVWVALWTIYIVWGSTYLAIRVMVETMPPLLSSGVRFALAGALFGGWLAARRGLGAIRLTGRELGSAALVGTLLVLGGNGVVALAERDVPSGLAALLIASEPLIVLVLRYATRERVPRGTSWAVAAGVVGVAILLLPGERPGGAPLWGMLALLGASTSWAVGSFISNRISLPRDPILSTAAQMLCGGAVMVATGLAAGEAAETDLGAFAADSIAAWIYLVVAGSLMAFTAYAWLLQNAPISKVSTYAYVNPVIAVMLGAVILSEEITVTVVAGAAIIVASVAFTVRRESEAELEDTLAAPAGAPALQRT